MNMNTFSPATRWESFADDLTMRIDERGNGRPILILHGTAGPQSVSGIASAIAEHAYVLTPTHPGFAGEPRPEWFTSVDDLALTYLDLLDLLDLRDVIVIGFSFGGWIAAELAMRDTRRLGALILVDAAGIQVDGHEMASPGAPGTSSARNNQQPGFNSAAQNPEQAAARAANLQALAVYTSEGMNDPKLRRRLARMRVPALVVWGENDPILSLDYGHAYAQALPNARFTLIPEAGHFPQFEQPERLLTIVREFVDSIAASPVPESSKER